MFYQKVKNGIKIHLKVVPNASKNEILDIVDGDFGIKILRIRVAAIPDDGKANKALIKFLSKEWKIPASDIKIIAGETARKKTLLVQGDIESYLSRILNN